MDNCSLPENLPDTENSIEKQLAVPRELTRAEFDTAKKMIGAKLQSAMHSLRHSVSSIHLLLAAQNPADMTASAANKMRSDGFKEVYELSGGIMKWRGANLPETTDNKVASSGMSQQQFDALINSDKLVLIDFYIN